MQEMICICDPDGMREAETLRLDVQRRLGVPRSEDVLMAVALSLVFDFQADVGIGIDMWCGVCARPFGSEDPADLLDKECDRPCDGLFFIWRELANKYPERVSATGPGCDIATGNVASAAVVTTFAMAYEKSENHKAGCADCPTSKYGMCDAGLALLNATEAAKESIINRWEPDGWIEAMAERCDRIYEARKASASAE